MSPARAGRSPGRRHGRLAATGLCAALVAVVTLAGAAPAFAKRVALVIGNGAYTNAVQLPNPVNDARAMAGKLEDLGFDVVAGYDQDYMSMRRTVGDFARAARGADIALLFYAGHGMQVRGQNYIIPTDAKFEDETALDFETVSIDFIVRQMSSDVRVRMIFLDACRDNPLARSLARRMNPSRSASVGTGLAEIKMEESGGEGSVIAFATSPGDVALDGDGGNSPFTAALLRHIDTPDTPIQNVMTRVTGDVYKSTEERQRPWVNASLIGEVYLNKTRQADPLKVASLQGAGAALPAAPAARLAPAGESAANMAWDQEKTLFEFAQKGGTVSDYEIYLGEYPAGHFAEIARNYIKRLKAAEKMTPAGQTAAAQPARQPFQQPGQQPGQQPIQQPHQSTVGLAPAPTVPSGWQGQPQQHASLQPQTGPGFQNGQTTFQNGQNGAPNGPQNGQGGVARNSEVGGPFVGSGPSIGDMVRSQPGTDFTEAQLGWDRSQRREAQARLNLAGYDLGRPDGAFGPKTRAALRGWQAANGIVATGYFTGPQFQVLSSQTESLYRAYEAEEKRIAASRAATRSSSGKTYNRRQSSGKRRNNGNGNGNAFGAAVVGGIIGGIIGGAISR